jgi:hypothetical protein
MSAVGTGPEWDRSAAGTVAERCTGPEWDRPAAGTVAARCTGPESDTTAELRRTLPRH